MTKMTKNERKLGEVTPEELTYIQLKLDWHDLGVRLALSVSGVALNVLVNDPHWKVRRMVAYNGYGLDKLKNDPDDRVRNAVEMVRKEQMYQEAKHIVNDMFNLR